ncbi:MAG TPA: DUF4410 domain-containing protein [Thermoanaerobaculia bacterium]|nr:DUF4410 domain-containing protein [Thermoanaerobaculia bacterium]
MSKAKLIVHSRQQAAALLLLILAPFAFARGSAKAVTEPGSYKNWGPDIDQIEIVKAFKVGDYDRVIVLPFDTSKTPLPDPKEKSYDSIRSVVDGYTETLSEALRDEVKGKMKVEMAPAAPKTAGTLILRGIVEDVSPGSRAKRYLVGYGAGAAGSRMSGELVDAKTGAVLVRFTQERRSGGTWKVAGGSDVQVMRDSVHATGQDIAHILEQF